MSKKLVFVLGLGIGAAVGVGASWRVLKEHYKKIADEEIASVKEWYYSKDSEQHSVEKEAEEEVKDSEVEEKQRMRTEYHNIIEKHYDRSDSATEYKISRHPYTIAPDEYGTKDDYETQTLSWYAGDSVLADYTTDDIIEDVDNTVGSDSLATFGQFEDNAVFVRNDATKTDYEILLDTGKYSDVVNRAYSGSEEE